MRPALRLLFVLYYFAFINWPLASQTIVPQIGHSSKIVEVTFSPDRNYYATVDMEGKIKIWELASRKMVQTLFSEYYYYFDINVGNRGGWRDFYGRADSFMHVTKAKLFYTLAEPLMHPTFSPDCKTIVAEGRVCSYNFDIATGRILNYLPAAVDVVHPPATLDTAWLQELHLLPLFDQGETDVEQTFVQNGLILLGNGQELRIINLGFPDTYVKTLSLRSPLVFFSRDTIMLGVSSDHPETIEAWHVGARVPFKIGTFNGHEQRIACLDVSADSSFLVAGGDDTKVCIWSLHSLAGRHEPIEVFNGHDKPLRYVKFKNNHAYINSIGAVDSLQDRWYSGESLEELTWPFYTPAEKLRGDDLGPAMGSRNPQRNYSSDSRFFYNRKTDTSNGDLEIYTDFDEEGRLIVNGRGSRPLGTIGSQLPLSYTPPHEIEPWISIEDALLSPKGNYLLLKQEITTYRAQRAESVPIVTLLWQDRESAENTWNGREKIRWQDIIQFQGNKEFLFSPDENFLSVRHIRVLKNAEAQFPRVDLYKLDAIKEKVWHGVPPQLSCTKLLSIPENLNSLTQVRFTADSRYLVIIRPDLITFWSLHTLQPVFYLLPDPMTNNLAITLPNGYYMYTGSPSVLEKLALVKDGRARSLRQFDLQLNRPDTVISTINHLLFGGISAATAEEINILQRAIQERQLRWSQQTFNNAPSINIVKSLPALTYDKKIKVKVIAASIHHLRQIRIWANGTPLPTDYISTKTKEYRQEYTIELLGQTVNVLEMTALDEAGVESPLERWLIDCRAPVQPKLHFIGIGVARYQHGSPLIHADADIRALASAFQKRFAGQFQLDTLINEAVTPSALEHLRQQLAQGNIDDIVIVFWAGHGALDPVTHEFYLQTYASQGVSQSLSISQLNSLLDATPARKKLVIVNACRAGEAYSDLQAFQKMKELFFDFRRSNGSTIITASGIDEDAFSARNAANSYLALALLAALENKHFKSGTRTIIPDQNGDGKMIISELYLYIKELLRDKLLIDPEIRDLEKPAVPEMRQQNIEMDFRL